MTTKVNSTVLANTAVTAGTYGGSTRIAFFNVDAQGRITNAGNTIPSIAANQLVGKVEANQVANGATYAINISGSATDAGAAASVPASGLSGTQYAYASSVRPGPTRLYRDDDNSAFNIRTFYNGSTNRWVLQGYNGDTVHNGVEVAYANNVLNGVYTNGSYSDPTWLTLTKSKVGLGNVENTALSTWTGSTNITTLGTVTSGSAPASDVYSWAKQSTKPTYTKSEVGLGSVDNTADAEKVVLRSGNGCRAWAIFDGTVNATTGDQYCTLIASYNITNVVKRGTFTFWANMNQSVNYSGDYKGFVKVTQMYNSNYTGSLAQQMNPQYIYGDGFASTSQPRMVINYPTNRILVEVWW